jgi:hypothetical protein
MIPADVLSRIQVAADMALLPVASIQEITDALSELSPGQRVMAEIRALLPNGTYRAVINQRDVTLALPFSAKSGDALELEVVNADGKLTFAVISRPASEGSTAATESVSTTLSRTGQLISTLLTRSGESKSEPAPTPLNGNRPIASTPPSTAQELIPLLKQALTQSGMFYESHQATWVDGQLDRSALLQEPQGKLPTQFASANAYQASSTALNANLLNAKPGDSLNTPRTASLPSSAINAAQGTNNDASITHVVAPDVGAPNISRTSSPQSLSTANVAAPAAADTIPMQNAGIESNATRSTAASTSNAHIVAPDVVPLVQQQLEALATHNFSWQGQIWPGQEMRWDITEHVDEEASRRAQGDGEAASNWQTRLHLTFPHLGAVDAQLRLQGAQISLVLTTGNTQTQALLRNATQALRSQLDGAGLALTTVGIAATTSEGENAQVKD